MEGQPRNHEDLPADETDRREAQVRRIYDGLEDAWCRGRRIDDLTAKRIAREIDPGSGPLHEFAETGAIPDGMDTHLAVAEEVVEDLAMQSNIPWIGALREYFDGRLIRSEMPYWNEPGIE
jgi:hypothetical protein